MAKRPIRKPENVRVLLELEDGDMIEFPRGVYSHWGVYVGNENVVHITGVDSVGTASDSSSSNLFTFCGIGYQKAVVQLDNFWNIVQNSIALKNNSKDRNARPLPKSEIKRRAKSKLGPLSYSVLWNNCEHFAAWCRYDVNWSEQANNALTGIVTVGALAVVGGLLYNAFKGNDDDD